MHEKQHDGGSLGLPDSIMDCHLSYLFYRAFANTFDILKFFALCHWPRVCLQNACHLFVGTCCKHAAATCQKSMNTSDVCCSGGNVIGIRSAKQLYRALQLAGIRPPLAFCRSASARKAMHSPALWLTPSPEGPDAASFFIKLSLQAHGLSGRHNSRHGCTVGRREPFLTLKQLECNNSRNG